MTDNLAKISSGLIIELAEQYHTPALGCIGAFRRTVKFPGELPSQFVSTLSNQTKASHHIVFLPYLADMKRSDLLLLKVNRHMLNCPHEIKEGMVFEASTFAPKFKGRVDSVRDDHIILDCNIFLAGMPNVWVDIYVVDIRNPSEEENTKKIDKLELIY